MAYRNREMTEAEAKRLGIDISGMSWPEMQKAVKEGLLREQVGEPKPKPVKESKPKKMSTLSEIDGVVSAV